MGSSCATFEADGRAPYWCWHIWVRMGVERGGWLPSRVMSMRGRSLFGVVWACRSRWRVCFGASWQM
jgi:hypothetical protein